MRVATYERGRLRFWTDPFEINVSNEFHFFTPSDSVQDVTLFAKYTLRADEMFLNRMIGGTFEGSNDPDFREKEVLYLINEKPKRLQTVVQSYSSKSYRYVRYIYPKDSHCNIAEAAFYTPNDTASLKGKVIGTPGCFQKMVRMSIQMYLMGMSQLLLIISNLPVVGQVLILELLSR